jgi:hypothetical protein
VRYGNADTALFNADCWAIVLLDYIKERCGYSALDEPVDLLKEDGSCIDLRSVGKQSASTVLEPKGNYILAKVVAPETEGGPPTFEQLWQPPEGYEAPPPQAAAGKKK